MTDQDQSNENSYDTGRPPVDGQNPSAPPPPPPGGANVQGPQGKKGGGALARTIAGICALLLISSLALNVWLGQLVGAVFSGPYELTYTEGETDQRVVILPVEGMINEATADFVRRSFEKLQRDEPAAVVLRVDSGGGGVGASDRIWHEVRQYQEETGVPVVASFGSAAASGGYYIAAPSDYIVAERTCTTGSIGVMGMAFTVDEMMDKIGVTPEVLEAPESPRKDIGNNIFRPWTEEDREVIRDRLAAAHRQFVEVVVQGRAEGRESLSPDRVRELAQGQIFGAEEALEDELIDEIGFTARAIEKSAELAGLDPETDPHVTEMQRRGGIGLGSMLGLSQSDNSGLGLNLNTSMDAEQARSLMIEATQNRPMYLAPIGG